MKVLRGSLKETRFAWPEQPHVPKPLKVLQERVFHENQVTYMSDQLGLHRIKNMDPHDFTYSLHRRFAPVPHRDHPWEGMADELTLFPVYTPPNAQQKGCHIFKRDTGESSHITLCNWYSELGQKL